MPRLIGAKPIRNDFKVSRSEDFFPASFKMRVRETDGSTNPLNFAGITPRMQIRHVAGSPGLVCDVPLVTDPTLTGIFILDEAGGEFQIVIRRTVWALALADFAQEVWRGAYDLVFTYTDGLQEVIMQGAFTVEPGVTMI